MDVDNTWGSHIPRLIIYWSIRSNIVCKRNALPNSLWGMPPVQGHAMHDNVLASHSKNFYNLGALSCICWLSSPNKYCYTVLQATQ